MLDPVRRGYGKLADALRPWLSPLSPIYDAWMRFARALSWVNTRIVLGVLWILVFTPYSVVLRLLGKDPMRRRFADGESYWRDAEHENSTLDQFERQY